MSAICREEDLLVLAAHVKIFVGENTGSTRKLGKSKWHDCLREKNLPKKSREITTRQISLVNIEFKPVVIPFVSRFWADITIIRIDGVIYQIALVVFSRQLQTRAKRRFLWNIFFSKYNLNVCCERKVNSQVCMNLNAFCLIHS